MRGQVRNSQKIAYAAMALVVVAWGFDYVAAKFALAFVQPIPLICIKYGVGGIALFIVKCVMDRRFAFGKKDVPLLICCAVFGEIIYYACEYGAMAYLPVSIISIMLAFVPVVSVVLEFVIWRRGANLKICAGIAVSVFGVGMVALGGGGEFFSVGAMGYVLVVGAVFAWNIYNFCTAGLARRYRPLDLTLYQTWCTTILSLPFLLHDMPGPEAFTGMSLAALLYLGIISEGVCFYIYVYAIDKLGPTPCAVFSNMLPITSSFFGWLLLGERIALLQIAGGVIVVASGIVVIWEKRKLDEKRQHNACVPGRRGI